MTRTGSSTRTGSPRGGYIFAESGGTGGTPELSGGQPSVDTYQVTTTNPVESASPNGDNLITDVEFQQVTDPPPAGSTLYTDTRVNFRAGPSTGDAVLSVLGPGTAVVVATPLETDGDWIRVVVNGVEGWIHMDLLSPNPPSAQPGGGGGGGSQIAGGNTGFVGSTYTNLGNVADVDAEMRRLAEQGIRTVRVWPFFGSGTPEDFANRARAVAAAAERYGMTVVLDFMSGFEGGGMDQYNAATEELQARMRAIVAATLDFSNITWSVGNELQAGVPSEGEQFTTWFLDQVRFLRRLLSSSGADSTRVTAEFTPGAVGHPDHDPAARDRIRRIAQALDEVSIHWYPAYSPGQLDAPANGDPWLADFQRDWNTILAWKDYATQIAFGEFAIDGDPNPDRNATSGPYRNPDSLLEWIQYLDAQPWVSRVLLWQYGVSGNEHIDGLSYDYYDGPYDDTRAVLVNAGYLR